MCGIAGILHWGGDGRVEERQLEKLRDEQTHRGPDDAGLWLSGDRRVGLAHRRLSIIDLSETGHQPMATSDGALRVVFNGEIYNFPQLREMLEASGHRFGTSSDTEVLLHGYREWGIGLLERLRGMFAFALHDAASGETLLARDPLGIKPLYFATEHEAGGGRFCFASEVQPLRSVVDDGGPDPEGLATYLYWGSIAAPRTLYRGIRALQAGCWMRVGPEGVEEPRAYYSVEEDFGRCEAMDQQEAAHVIRAALVDSVRHHLLADVPVGAFLSGGVDSSALVGLLSEAHSGPVRTVTLSFDEAELDEGCLAHQAAELYGAEHRDVPIRIDEIRDRIPDAVRALDQPSVDGTNTYFVAEAAVRAGLKVAVSGVGGDELFGGYTTFERVPRLMQLHARFGSVPGLLPLASRAAGWVARRTWDSRIAKVSTHLAVGADVAGAYYAVRGLFSPEEVRSLLAPELAEAIECCDPRRALLEQLRLESLAEDERVSALELSRYMRIQLLRDTDAVSMRHSLEVRTPLVDRDLLRSVARVPAVLRRAGPAKLHLRQAPRPPVPDALWRRTKQGFTLPFDRWLRSGALPIELPQHPWLRRDGLEGVMRGFMAGRTHWSRPWSLFVLGSYLD